MKISEMQKTSAKWRKKLLRVILITVVCCLAYSRGEPSQGAPPKYVTDDVGERVVLGEGAPRIISLYIGHTENLAAIGAGDAVIATGHETEDMGISVPVLSQKPGIEQIAALKPDLVLTRPMMARSQEPLYGALKAMGIRVIALDPPGWDGFPKYIETLWKIAGTGDMPKNFIKDAMPEAEIPPDDGKTRVFLVTNGRTMATCTDDSWASHIMKLAGLKNVAEGAEPIAKGSVVAAFGAERLLSLGDVIDAVLLQQGAMNTTSALDFMSDPRFASMKAVRNGMVFDVPEADISRPSLLRLKNGVVQSLREKVISGGRF